VVGGVWVVSVEGVEVLWWCGGVASTDEAERKEDGRLFKGDGGEARMKGEKRGLKDRWLHS
jgi:hypothetical protein